MIDATANNPSAKTLRHDAIGAVLIDMQGNPTNLYRKCPHCGMVDLQFSANGAKQSHHQICRVGSIIKYECGKCRKQFHVLELCVPAGEEPLTYYEQHLAPVLDQGGI